VKIKNRLPIGSLLQHGSRGVVFATPVKQKSEETDLRSV